MYSRSTSTVIIEKSFVYPDGNVEIELTPKYKNKQIIIEGKKYIKNT